MDRSGIHCLDSKSENLLLQVTLADVYIGELLDRIDRIFDPGLLSNYPDLKDFVERLHALPGLAKRLKERPSYTL